MSEPDAAQDPGAAGEPGGQLGHYTLLRKIAEGGMGAVFEARQESPRRTVALKVIRPDLSSPELLRRFEHEAQILGRLQHPYIAQIYEAGTAEGERGTQPYFAMELVEGETLTEYADRRQLGMRERLELMQRVAEGVNHAHQKGVIHRDLKPGNVLVQEDGTPKILDFGVARVTDADVKATMQTDVGQLLGTLPYMSPEQVAADPLELDTRSDVYALGVMLYELLTGELPYDTEGRMIHEVARIIREVDPRPLSSINQRLQGDVDTLVGKALEKDRTHRYQSASALAEDLGRFLRDEPIVARRPSLRYQLTKFARRNQALVTGVLGVFLALVAGAVVATLEAVRANRAEDVAMERAEVARVAKLEAERERADADAARVAERAAREEAEAAAQRAREEAAKATVTSEFLVGMLESIQPEHARGRDVTVAELLDEAARSLETGSLLGSGRVEVGVRRTLGRTYFALARYEEARVQIERALAMHREIGRDPLQRLALEFDVAKLDLVTGRYEEAESGLLAVYESTRALAGEESEDLALVLGRLASLRHDQSRFEESVYLARQFDELWRELHPAGSVERAEGLGVLSFHLHAARQYDEAQAVTEEALEIFEATGDLDHPQRLRLIMRLANIHRARERTGEAALALEEARELAQRLYSADHPLVADVCQDLGVLLRSQRRLDEALPYFERSLEIRRARLGPSRDTAVALAALGGALREFGRLEEAEAACRESLAMRRAVFGEESAAIGDSLRILGDVLVEQGRLEEAREALGAAVENWRTYLPPGHVDLRQALAAYAKVLRALGRYAQARDALQESLRLTAKIFPPGSYQQDEVRDALIQVLLDGEEWEAAEALVHETSRLGPPKRAAEQANLDVALGAALAGQERFEEAEALLLRGWEVLVADPRLWDRTKAQAAERLRWFYEAAGGPEEAEHWREVRDGYRD